MAFLSKEARFFFCKFWRHPKRIGSIVPSSKYLAIAMVSTVAWDKTRAVAELGAGTGAITRLLDLHVRPGTNVFLFERDAMMRDELKLKFPGYRCFPNAADMQRILERTGGGRLDAILSGLPFCNFPQTLRNRLFKQIDEALKPGGQFIAFQYSLRMRKQLADVFEIEHIKFVPLNIPPAFVYVCRKREAEGKGVHGAADNSDCG